jgi:hypothetical protein
MKRWVLFLLIVLSMLVVSCGGGTGGDDQPSSRWDEMNWDQGEWS